MTEKNPLFKDDVEIKDYNFNPINPSTTFDHLFPTAFDAFLGVGGLILVAFLVYGLLVNIYKCKTVNDYVSSAMLSAFVSWLVFIMAMTTQVPQMINKNAQEVSHGQQFNNIKVVHDFIDRVPEYKNKLNAEYSPHNLKVYEADTSLGNGTVQKVHIFFDSKTGVTSVRMLTPDTIKTLEETAKDSVRR